MVPENHIPPKKTPPGQEKKEETPKVEATAEEKKYGLMGYIPLGFILPLLTKPKSKFCQFHSKQGAVILIGWIVVMILFIIFIRIAFLSILIFLAYFGFNVIAAYRTYRGEMWRIPIVSDFAEKINIEGLITPKKEKSEEKKEEKKERER